MNSQETQAGSVEEYLEFSSGADPSACPQHLFQIPHLGKLIYTIAIVKECLCDYQEAFPRHHRGDITQDSIHMLIGPIMEDVFDHVQIAPSRDRFQKAASDERAAIGDVGLANLLVYEIGHVGLIENRSLYMRAGLQDRGKHAGSAAPDVDHVVILVKLEVFGDDLSLPLSGGMHVIDEPVVGVRARPVVIVERFSKLALESHASRRDHLQNMLARRIQLLAPEQHITAKPRALGGPQLLRNHRVSILAIFIRGKYSESSQCPHELFDLGLVACREFGKFSG